MRPRFLGRMIGIAYLVLTASGFDLFYVLPRIYVGGDAAATAANIKAHESLFYAGFAAALVGVASYLVVTALFYRLYEPVDRTLSLCAALFSLTGTIVQAVALVFHLLPVIVLADQPWLRAFTPDQRHAMALFFLRSYGETYNISLLFFAFYLLQLGYLTYRSTFLPRWLGVVVAFGAGWLVYAFPPLAHVTGRYVALCSVGELLLILWLSFKGVDEKRWYEEARQKGLVAGEGFEPSTFGL